MSKKVMSWDRFKVQRHCAEGRCTHQIYKLSQCLICRNFLSLIKSGKNPTNCPYYNHSLDYQKN